MEEGRRKYEPRRRKGREGRGKFGNGFCNGFNGCQFGNEQCTDGWKIKIFQAGESVVAGIFSATDSRPTID